MRVCAVVGLLGSVAGAVPSPEVVETVLPTGDVVVASYVLTPPADPDSDFSGALQQAIDDAARSGGAVIFLSSGRYPLHKPVILREGVTLRGEWTDDPGRNAESGTILMPLSGAGDPGAAPAFTVERGTGVCNMTVWYPEQTPGNVVPYPWTFFFSQTKNGDNCTFQNLTLVNCFNAIKIGPEWNELHTIRNVRGTPLKTGIWVDSTTDIGRILDVRFSSEIWEDSCLPGAPSEGSAAESIRDHLSAEAVGVEMGRSDWEYIYRLEVEGYRTGVHFRRGARGATNAVMLLCELHSCGIGLKVDELNHVGLAATGCRFQGREHAVSAGEEFGTVAQFNSCRFEGPAGVLVDQAGEGLFTFQNCGFFQWGTRAVNARGGQVSLIDCHFAERENHIILHPEVRRARILSNRFDGAPDIDDRTRSADLLVSHIPREFPRPDLTEHRWAPVPSPATRKLFDVTAFGASAELPDNTSAFADALSAAETAGGGTVYVPAGYYRFEGEFTVPSGVELRGVFDVPHHTASGGSVLMPTAGAGDEEGTPFVTLAGGAGLRGLTVWYPEQTIIPPRPYPWTVRGTGPGCWLIDVTMVNSFRGVDLWTHQSTGHVVRYLAGGFFKCGLKISKSDGPGWVENIQFNPHYMLRPHGEMSLPKLPGDVGRRLQEYQRANLDGIVFGRCRKEHIFGTFLYAAREGIAFREDAGSANARILIHGTDTGSRGCALTSQGGNLEFLNAQLVPKSASPEGAIFAGRSFSGDASFFNTQIWGGRLAPSAQIRGNGRVVVQQVNTLSGPFIVDGGEFSLQNGSFARSMSEHVAVEPGTASAEILGVLYKGGALNVENSIGEKCEQFANGCSVIPADTVPDLPASLMLDFESEQVASFGRIARAGGDIRNVKQHRCRVLERGDAKSGTRVLKLSGRATRRGHSFVYCLAHMGPIVVRTDTTLSYWMMPLNEAGRNAGVDLLFKNGKVLRDIPIESTAGEGIHPAQPRGRVDSWTRIEIPLGALAGRVIEYIMVAFDRKAVPGDFVVLFDDIRLESHVSASAFTLSASPKGGRCSRNTSIRIHTGGSPDIRVRYTLDGSNPTHESPLYRKPIRLPGPGAVEVRFAVQTKSGKLSPVIRAVIYDVQ